MMRDRTMLLIFCRLTLDIAGLLVPEQARPEWKREWKSELWHRSVSLEDPGENSGLAAWRLYLSCLGAFADAWWHFTEADSVVANLTERVRSPSLCLGSLGLLLVVWICITGFLPTTRMIFCPLAYANASQIALVSRTGRMEAVRRGIPRALAELWVNKSRSITQLAMCSFARRGNVTMAGRRLKAVSIIATPNLFDVLGLAAILFT